MVNLRRGEGSSQYFHKNPNLYNAPHSAMVPHSQRVLPFVLCLLAPFELHKINNSLHLPVQPRSNGVVLLVVGPTTPLWVWPAVANVVTIPLIIQKSYS